MLAAIARNGMKAATRREVRRPVGSMLYFVRKRTWGRAGMNQILGFRRLESERWEGFCSEDVLAKKVDRENFGGTRCLTYLDTRILIHDSALDGIAAKGRSCHRNMHVGFAIVYMYCTLNALELQLAYNDNDKSFYL